MPKRSVSRIPYVIEAVAKKPVELVRATVDDTADLLGRSGELKFGQGMIATVVAFSLGVLCLLGVLAFHFPQYLTTPELRHQYSVDVLRQAMFFALLIAGGLALACTCPGVR
jgi:hypothetical protein